MSLRKVTSLLVSAAKTKRPVLLGVSKGNFSIQDIGGALAFSTSEVSYNGTNYNKPQTADELHRSGGIASMMRLPIQETAQGLDACFVGVPLDTGTSNRTGARYGPRWIRAESPLLKGVNKETGAMPFQSIQVADVGDLYVTMYDLHKACDDITKGIADIIKDGCRPLVLGGDHTITYPILRAFKNKYGPVAVVHVDAHTDTAPQMNGCKIAHGTPFYRAVEEGLVNPHKVVQIGIRGPGWSTDDTLWGMQQGFRVIPARHCHYKSLVPLMKEVREMIGDTPAYISFDIDGLDPAYAPGTGTPEIGGLTSFQGLEIIRGCKELNIVGADLVEVSPPYDHGGITAVTGANLLFEMLCVLPGVKYQDISV